MAGDSWWMAGCAALASFSSHRSRSRSTSSSSALALALTPAPCLFWLVHISSFLCLPQLRGIFARNWVGALLLLLLPQHISFSSLLRQPQGTCLKITHNLFTINKMRNKKSRRWPPVIRNREERQKQSQK